jgi:DNA modification methylase
MIHILQGDCRTVLARLAPASVHCVVTSPPYFGLRDYGTATWEGGDAGCDHVQGMARQDTERETPGGRGGSFRGGTVQFRDTCGKCGARRTDAQIGLEASPEAYVAGLVETFREVRRVLRDDGTVWLNIGDSYNAAGRIGHGTRIGYKQGTNRASESGEDHARATDASRKPKDLLMIPARVALALQADGWWLRSDIIWNKPSCMPESVTDRPTNAHEHVFLLTKAARYFYDAEAVAEPISASSVGRFGTNMARKSPGAAPDRNDTDAEHRGEKTCGFSASGRNLRNVWTIATQPFSGAHFATMPAELAERCIRAGTPEHGVCATCGTPWKRIAQRGQSDYARLGKHQTTRGDSTPNGFGHTRAANGTVPSLRARSVIATDWKRGCRCQGVSRVPATVLDPFAGAFTTALAADRLGRDAIGIELNERYCRMARERLEDDAGMFAALSEQAPTAAVTDDDGNCQASLL